LSFSFLIEELLLVQIDIARRDTAFFFVRKIAFLPPYTRYFPFLLLFLLFPSPAAPLFTTRESTTTTATYWSQIHM
jgi:hypothetical protein